MCQVEDRGGNPIQAYLQSPIQSIHICLYPHKYTVSWVFTFGQNSCFYSSQVLWRRLPKLSMFWLQSGRIAILLDSGCAPDWEWQSMFIHSRGGGGGGMPLQCPFTPLSFVLAAAAAAGLLSSLVPASPFLGHSFASCPETPPVWNVLYLEKSLLALQNWIYWQRKYFWPLGPRVYHIRLTGSLFQFTSSSRGI